MTPRKLSLRTERLAELTTGELGSVVGASGSVCATNLLCQQTIVCIPTQGCTGYYPSIFDPCA